MRENRRPLSRWLAGLAVVVGLFAMHGLTATTASAAVHCGGMPTHAHAQGEPAELTELAGPATLTTMGVSTTGLDGGHAGALCVATLLAGLVIAALIRRERRPAPMQVRGADTSRPSRGVRAPPDRADLSVWRN